MTTIDTSSFIKLSNLISITMPDSVTHINQGAFSYCDNLMNITIPGVTNIGRMAFSYCNNLTSVDMPSVTDIESSAFSGCQNITSVTFGMGEITI